MSTTTLTPTPNTHAKESASPTQAKSTTTTTRNTLDTATIRRSPIAFNAIVYPVRTLATPPHFVLDYQI